MSSATASASVPKVVDWFSLRVAVPSASHVERWGTVMGVDCESVYVAPCAGVCWWLCTHHASWVPWLFSETAVLAAITSAGGILAFQPVLRAVIKHGTKLGDKVKRRSSQSVKSCGRCLAYGCIGTLGALYVLIALVCSATFGKAPHLIGCLGCALTAEPCVVVHCSGVRSPGVRCHVGVVIYRAHQPHGHHQLVWRDCVRDAAHTAALLPSATRKAGQQ